MLKILWSQTYTAALFNASMPQIHPKNAEWENPVSPVISDAVPAGKICT